MNKTPWYVVVALGMTLSALGGPAHLEAQRSGAEIWRATCGNCHVLQPPGRYTAKDWRSIGTHMVITARLTTARGEAVLEFLRQGARETAGAPSREPDLARADGTRDPATVPEVESPASPPSVTSNLSAYLRELGPVVPPGIDETDLPD